MQGQFKKGLVMMGLLLMAGYSSMSLAKDTPAQVGQDTIQIPIPTGFTVLTEDMKPLYDIKQKLVPPSNREVIAIIPDEDAKSASAGKIPVVHRSFSTQVSHQFEGHQLSDIQFAALKSIIRDKNQELAAMAQEHVNENLANQSADINQQMKSKVDVHLSMTDHTVLPVHEDTPTSISWSMYVKMNVGFGSNPDKDHAEKTAVVTSTIAHIHGQVLFFYVTGGENDLDWTRDAAKQWMAAVMHDNP